MLPTVFQGNNKDEPPGYGHCASLVLVPRLNKIWTIKSNSRTDPPTTLFNADYNSPAVYDNDIAFTGYRLDSESGLHYAPYRYQHPVLGLFVTRDPLGYQDGMNLYGYCGGRPVGWVDPFGLKKVCTLLRIETQGHKHGDRKVLVCREGLIIYECRNGKWLKILDTRREKLPTGLWENIPREYAYNIATAYYGETIEGALGDGTLYLGFGGRVVLFGGPELYAGLRLNLTAEAMLSPYVTTGGGIGFEAAAGPELGYVPGGINKFNGVALNFNVSTPYGSGAGTIPWDVGGGTGFSKLGLSISTPAAGGSTTITHTWSFK